MFKDLEIFKWWELSYVEDIFASTALAVLVDGIQLGNNLRKNQANLSSKSLYGVPN